MIGSNVEVDTDTTGFLTVVGRDLKGSSGEI